MRLYHVSYDDLGPAPKLQPKVPLSPLKNEEAKTARISMAPRVADCLRMVPWRDYQHKLWVYACSVPRRLPDYPVSGEGKVPDWERGSREEYWLLKSMVFKRVGRVRMFPVLAIFKEQSLKFWGWCKGGDAWADDSWTLHGTEWKRAVEGEVSMKLASRRMAAHNRELVKKVAGWK